ncbi:hypothetical protein RHSIM_Rhsim08G0107100 [Rhododendron simsii]|uniref:AB hydrolase-1 domain-containing protein n=1 Tax=Rhododendron simsii TaxID=118357 RepID=A0A834LGP2_RHOSS|nr:hypothetical protein RHSIM_Rhsim08G0107100 [Rhododendron simsii]
MAASGVHPKQVDELRSVSDYSQPLMEFMESLPADDQVVLVGHSAGGISISVAMERFPEKISVAAFVASFMHGPDLNLATVFRKDTALTKENYGSMRRVYILIEEDKVVKESLQRWMIENNPTDEVRVIPGLDHMVMLSKPKELIECLLGLAS